MKNITVIADSRNSQLSAFIRLGGNPLYRILLKKNYKIPKAYIQWRELAATISLLAPVFDNNICDLAQRYTSHRAALWVVQDAPIYCLDEKLLENFQQTDIGDENLIFRDLVSQIPLHSIMLLLPSKTIVSPDGGYIDWLNIHCSHKQHPEWSMGEKYGLRPHFMTHEDDAILHFGSVDTKGTVWFSGWAINEADGKIKHTDISYGTARISKGDEVFVKELRSLAMQCLMFLTFEKLETDNVTFKESITSNTGFVPIKEPKEKCLYPRWLRDNEKCQARHIRNTSHSSPSPHWRRGHWRRAAIGRGRLHRRWNWIKPTFVTGDS